MLLDLHTWTSGGGAVWEGRGRAALLERTQHWKLDATSVIPVVPEACHLLPCGLTPPHSKPLNLSRRSSPLYIAWVVVIVTATRSNYLPTVPICFGHGGKES